MPFKSELQRKFMWMKHPEIAKKWSKESPKEAVLSEMKKRIKNKGRKKINK